MPPVFYVYLLFRMNGIPCYVGKGKEDRWLDHERSRLSRTNRHLGNIIKQARSLGKELPKIKLAEGLTEEKAFEIERLFIATIGREAHGGPLVNLTDGGDGISGLVFTAEHRANISSSHKGLKRSETTKRKMSEKAKGRIFSKEHCTNISAALVGKKKKPWSEEFRAKYKSLNNPGHTGHQHSEKTRMEMSARTKRYFSSKENRAKTSAATSLAITAWWKRRKAQNSNQPDI